jgi:hypothetical protein
MYKSFIDTLYVERLLGGHNHRCEDNVKLDVTYFKTGKVKLLFFLILPHIQGVLLRKFSSFICFSF